MNQKQLYDWKRFWCKPEDKIVLDRSGFLLDPDSDDSRYTKTDVKSFREIEDIQCLIMLGEPGIGKSIALEKELENLKIKNDGKFILYKNLNEYGDESRLINDVFKSDTLNDWLKTEKDLILIFDSFDECLIEVKKLPAIFKSQLSQLKGHSQRIQIKIACRTGFWANSLTNYFNVFFGKDHVGIYELAPLRRKDVEIAAKSIEINSDIFIQEVINNEFQTLAINPLTLEMLLKEFHFHNIFVSSKEELFLNGCKTLCTEPNEERNFSSLKEPISPEKRISIASRIAAIMIFCNKLFVDLKNQSEANKYAINLDMLMEGEETTGEYSFTFSQQDLKETITQTSLFTSRGDSKFGFSHLTYTEFLAGKFIVNHKFEMNQIKSLITISGDPEKKIIPQIKSTVAWLGVFSKEVTDFIISHDPQILLYGDILTLSSFYKERIVESLLSKFNNNSINDFDWDLHRQYRKLKYPGLSEQIRPYIENSDTYFLSRRAAFEIAQACNLTDLNEPILQVALNNSEKIYVRRDAVHSLISIGNKEIRKKLIPLAVNPQDDDENDDLKGNALRALWPSELSTKDVFKILTLPKKSNYGGAYVLFMYSLYEEIKPDDLDVCLNWILKYSDDSDDVEFRFERLENLIIYMCWTNLNAISDSSLFVRVLLDRIYHHKNIYPVPESFGKKWPPLVVDDNTKSNVLYKVIEKIDVNKLHLVFHNDLLSYDDFYNVFDQFIMEERKEVKIKWARLLKYTSITGINAISLLASNLNKYEELKIEFKDLFEPIELGSPKAEKLKNSWQQQLKWREDAEKRKIKEESKKINVRDLLIKRLDDFELNRTIASWFQFFRDLTIDESSSRYGDEFNSDVTSLPGWIYINDSMKNRIVSLSKIYITNFNENVGEWFCTNTFYRPATAGYKSLILLYKFEPSFVINLESKFWRNWKYILIDYPETYGISGNDETYLEIIKVAYTIIPDEIILVLLSVIDNRNKQEDPHLFVLHKVEACFDSRMQRALVSKIQDNSLKPLAQNYIFNKLLEKKNDDAVSLVKKKISESFGELKIELAKSLANNCDKEGWDYVMLEIKKDNNFGKDFFLSFVSNYVVQSIPLLDRITELQIAELFIWLSDNFPKKEDPEFEGAHTVGSRESVGNFRDQILRDLTVKGTLASIEALRKIEQKRPELNLKFHLIEAKQNYRKDNWKPLNPNELMFLANNQNARIISSPNDLLNLLVESLERIEVILQGNNPQSFSLWNEDSRNPKSEEKLSEFLKFHLSNDLKKYGISSYREVQLRNPKDIEGGKKGEKVDLLVTYTHPKTRESYEVIIEIKGSWNKDINTSMETQLLNRYLKEGNCVHGLYLIGWYNCNAFKNQINKTGCATIQEARILYEEKANCISDCYKTIRSFVLDCSL